MQILSHKPIASSPKEVNDLRHYMNIRFQFTEERAEEVEQVLNSSLATGKKSGQKVQGTHFKPVL